MRIVHWRVVAHYAYFNSFSIWFTSQDKPYAKSIANFGRNFVRVAYKFNIFVCITLALSVRRGFSLYEIPFICTQVQNLRFCYLYGAFSNASSGAT